MPETVEELVTKHTRRELEEMALKLGIDSLGGTKAQLAETIIEAGKRVKEAPRPMEPVKVAPPLAEAVTAKKPVQKDAPREPAPVMEKSSEFARAGPAAGHRGVLAKSEAIEKAAGELQKAGREIREDGIRAMNRGISEFRRDLDAQMNENRNAIATLNRGALEIRSEMDDMSRGMQRYGQDLREEGMRKMSKGVSTLRKDIDSQRRENLDAAAKLNLGACEIRSEADRLSREMQKFGKDLRDDGTRRLQSGVAEMYKDIGEFRSAIDAQAKVNEEGVSKLNAGSREIRSSMDRMSRGFQKAGKVIRENGARNLQKEISEFNKGLAMQIKSNKDASMKMASGSRALQASARAYQGEIQRYREQDLKDYVHDFYYG